MAAGGKPASRIAMRRLVALLIALVAAWLGAASIGPAQAPSGFAVHTYIDDGQHGHTAARSATFERGPPSTSGYAITYDVVDRLSRSGSACPDGSTPRGRNTDDDPTALAQVAHIDSSDRTVQTASVPREAEMGALSSTIVAAKALPSGPKIAAEWGADTYRHGGLMSTIEHINYRHAYDSGFSGVSRYAEGTSVRDIKGYVDYVLRNGTVTDRGVIGNVGRTIGTDAAGNPVTGLEVIVRDGMIKTAFPVAAP